MYDYDLGDVLIYLFLAAIVMGSLIQSLRWGYKNVYLKKPPSERQDFLIGFLGSIVVNAVLFGVLYFGNYFAATWSQTAILIIPWVINGGLLILTLIFRPQIAAGIFSFFGFLIGWGFLSTGLFAVSCFVYIVIALIFGPLIG